MNRRTLLSFLLTLPGLGFLSRTAAGSETGVAGAYPYPKLKNISNLERDEIFIIPNVDNVLCWNDIKADWTDFILDGCCQEKVEQVICLGISSKESPFGADCWSKLVDRMMNRGPDTTSDRKERAKKAFGAEGEFQGYFNIK